MATIRLSGIIQVNNNLEQTEKELKLMGYGREKYSENIFSMNFEDEISNVSISLDKVELYQILDFLKKQDLPVSINVSKVEDEDNTPSERKTSEVVDKKEVEFLLNDYVNGLFCRKDISIARPYCSNTIADSINKFLSKHLSSFIEKQTSEVEVVEFIGWVTKNYVLFYNPDKKSEKCWFKSGVDEKDVIFYNSAELFTIYKNKK